MTYQRTDLESGIRVLTESMPAVRSVTLGLWVGAGSRDEPVELAGATHFLEHLLFKGTATRTAKDIAEVFDEVGGEVNAFTAKEFTCFYARVLDEDMPMAVEVLSDMLQNSTLDPDEVESERTVVLEEIGMHEDAPDDIIHDLFCETIWGDHPLGRRIQGSVDTVRPMPRDAIDAYFRLHYRPGNLVIAAAGSLEHSDVVEQVAKAYAGAPPGPQRTARSGEEAPSMRSGVHVVGRKLEQTHLVYGTGGLGRNDPRRWALGVLNNVLGGGMSSRLFQEIREKRGLAYNVYSMHSSFAETGLFNVYAATAPARLTQVLDVIREQVDQVRDGGITDVELARGKGHLKGSLVLGLEDTGGRMSRLGKGELCHGEILSPDEVIARIDAVTPDDVRSVASEVLGSAPWALAVLGPGDGEDFTRFV
jgi:predicted Zn-dependent peptidase